MYIQVDVMLTKYFVGITQFVDILFYSLSIGEKGK